MSPAAAVLPTVVSPAVAVPATSQAADVQTLVAILASAARRSVRVAWPSCVLVSLPRSAAKLHAVVLTAAKRAAVVPMTAANPAAVALAEL